MALVFAPLVWLLVVTEDEVEGRVAGSAIRYYKWIIGNCREG